MSPSFLRERYFSRCGESRERKGENVFRHPPLPARGCCALKRSLPPTLLAHSSVQEDATSWRGQLVLHEAWFASYLAGTLSVSNSTVCDAQLRKSNMLADVRLERTRDNATCVATFMALGLKESSVSRKGCVSGTLLSLCGEQVLASPPYSVVLFLRSPHGLEVTEGRPDCSSNSSPENLRTGGSSFLNPSWMVATQSTPWSSSRRYEQRLKHCQCSMSGSRVLSEKWPMKKPQ